VATILREIRVLGVHPVVPSATEFAKTLEWQWGSDLSGPALESARRNVQEHYSRLFLIEIKIEPANAKIDWGEFTQPIPGEPRSSWQVPYDERSIAKTSGHWAFFLHFVDVARPLSTPLGERPLPRPTPIPSHLVSIKYEAP
jgi:hypothetical protein